MDEETVYLVSADVLAPTVVYAVRRGQVAEFRRQFPATTWHVLAHGVVDMREAKFLPQS